MIQNRLLIGLISAAAYALLAGGCITGPIVECTGSATYPCPNGTCAISPDACPVDPGCPNTFPARCDQTFCAYDINTCQTQTLSADQTPAPDAPVVKAPLPQQGDGGSAPATPNQ